MEKVCLDYRIIVEDFCVESMEMLEIIQTRLSVNQCLLEETQGIKQVLSKMINLKDITFVLLVDKEEGQAYHVCLTVIALKLHVIPQMKVEMKHAQKMLLFILSSNQGNMCS